MILHGHTAGTRTVIVNLLYGNSRGIILKKLSSYSPRMIAFRATLARMGLIDGGNLPFVSQFSAQPQIRQRVGKRCQGRTTFRDGILEYCELGLKLVAEGMLKQSVSMRCARSRSRGKYVPPPFDVS